MAKTQQQKIDESIAARKASEQETKITPERQKQIETAERSTRVRAQKLAGQKTQAESQVALGQVPAGVNIARGQELLALESAGKTPEEPLTAAEARSKNFARNLTSREIEQQRQEAASTEFRSQLETGEAGRTTLRRGEVTPVREDIQGDFAAQLREEVGGISATEGPTAEQKQAIKAIEDFNQRFDLQQKQTEAKTEAQAKRGTFTAGVPAAELVGELSDAAPDVFQDIATLGGNAFADAETTAQANFDLKESSRSRQLNSALSQLSLGGEAQNVLQAFGGNLGQLSLPQLEALAQVSGLELTPELKASLQRDGKAAIERELITTNDRQAENEYSKRQLARTYDRSITDREEFNTQQDARLRRLAAAFGGGKVASLGANVSVMKETEKGQRVLEDIRSDFADKSMLVSRQADSIIETYGNNVQIIENQMATAIENKYAEITNTIDDLLDSGITDEIELNNAVLKNKKEYANFYADVSLKAFEAIQDENARLFDEDIRMRDILIREKNAEPDSRIVKTDTGTFIETAEGTFVPIESLTEGIETLDNTRLVSGGASNGAGRNDPTIFMNNINIQGNQLIDSDGNKIARVTSGFGADHSSLSGEKNHNGVDVVFPDGQVAATAGGTIVKKGFSPDTYGGWAWVQDGNGNVLQYGHMNVDDINSLEIGQTFGQGDQIGNHETDPAKWGSSSGAHTDIRYVGSGDAVQEGAEETALSRFKDIARTSGITDPKKQQAFAEKRLEESFKKLTDVEGKAFNAFLIMDTENRDYDQIIQDVDLEDFSDKINTITRKATEAGQSITADLINNTIKDPKLRQVMMSEFRWLEGALREESGAAISPAEYSTKGTAFFPRTGDDQGTIEKKRRARLLVTQGKFGKAGPSGQRQIGEILSSPEFQIEAPVTDQTTVTDPDGNQFTIATDQLDAFLSQNPTFK